MRTKVIIFIALFFVSFNAFSQSESAKSGNKKMAIEINGGKMFSPYRFYKNHNAYEHISLGVSRDISDNYGLLLSQSYGRIFSERTSNRVFVMTTTINVYTNLFSDKKINLRIAGGTGLLHLYTQRLSNIYPFSEHIYGLPFRLNFAFIYNLSEHLAVNVNLDANYNFLLLRRYRRLIIGDPYYYQTSFPSVNIGLSWSF